MTGHLPVFPAARAAASCGRPLQGVRALACLDLCELGDERVALGFRETGDRSSLSLDAKA